MKYLEQDVRNSRNPLKTLEDEIQDKYELITWLCFTLGISMVCWFINFP